VVAVLKIIIYVVIGVNLIMQNHTRRLKLKLHLTYILLHWQHPQVAKLRQRLAMRGESGRMRKQEKMLRLLSEMEKLSKAAVQGSSASHLYPPQPQEMVNRIGGEVRNEY
jgi:hypothetical protein